MYRWFDQFVPFIKSILVVMVIVPLIVPPNVISDEVDQIEDQIEQKNAEKKQKEAILKSTQDKINKILSGGLSIDQKIAAMDKDIKAAEESMKKADKDIKDREKQIKDRNEEISTKRKQATTLVNQLYKDANRSYLEMLLSADSGEVFLRSYFYRRELINTNLEIVQQLDVEIAELAVEQEKLKADKSLLAAEKSALDESMAILANEKARIQQEIYAEALRRAALQRELNALNSQLGNLSKALQDAINAKAPVDGGGNTGGGSSSAGTSPQDPLGNPGKYDVYVDGTKVANNVPGPIRAVAGSNNVYRVNGSNQYRGILEFRADSNVYMINELPLEIYLKGIGEMPSSWNQNALRAQAVAARSYAVKNWNKRASVGYNLRDDTFDQNYVGYSKEIDYGGAWSSAVVATDKKILKYGSDIVSTYYHSTCGGHTLGSEEVWISALPYTRPESDWYQSGGTWKSYDANSRWSHWQPGSGTVTADVAHDLINASLYLSVDPTSATRQSHIMRSDLTSTGYTAAQMRDALGAGNTSQDRVGNITNIQAIYNTNSTSLSGAVRKTTKLRITGDIGTIELNSEHFRTVFNARSPGTLSMAYSNLWDVSKSGSNWVFKQRGYPHRVGMCQYGAQGRAVAGQSYSQILSHYYRGTAIANHTPPANFRAGITRVATGNVYVVGTTNSVVYANGTAVANASPDVSIRIVKR